MYGNILTYSNRIYVIFNRNGDIFAAYFSFGIGCRNGYGVSSQIGTGIIKLCLVKDYRNQLAIVKRAVVHISDGNACISGSIQFRSYVWKGNDGWVGIIKYFNL